jgi:PadR family transcriptional regulator, regulatory protein AphA
MSLSFGLLGLINSCPLSGYDLKKLFEKSVHFFWSAQVSQIYRELKALERAGSVVSTVESSRSGPNRKIYRITDVGKARLREWLLDDSREIGEDDRNEFLLRVFLSSSIGGGELLGLLRKRLEKYKRDLGRLEASESSIPEYAEKFDLAKERLFWRVALRRGYHDVRSHIQWAEESIRFLEDQGFSAP